MDVLNYRDVCTKKPWYEVTPDGYMAHGNNGAREVVTSDIPMPEDNTKVYPKTQADFMREYHPTGHRIFDRTAYPDVWKKDPDTGRLFRQEIQRVAFAFQQLIAQKHILHLTGNDIQLEISQGRTDEGKEEEYQKLLTVFKKGWLDADADQRFFEAIRSWQITADCAIVGFIRKNRDIGLKCLSYLNGDVLYPQFDSITGELEVFGRKYYDYDENGLVKTEWLEVWDSKNLYRFNKVIDGKDDKDLVTPLGNGYAVIGWHLVGTPKPHGFPFIPICYARRDDGPCWSPVQRNIENYEEAFSYLCENNKAYAFPVFYFQGDGESLQVQGNMNGAVKAVAVDDANAKMGFLNGTDASNAFAAQLDKSYSLIYELSFTVKPPELKSGDLPGVALKLLYSPAIECGMNDAQLLQPFLSDLVHIMAYAIGYKNNNQASMLELPINTWIEVYVHNNKTEVVTNLATAVQNNFLSKQTASERCPDFPKNDEWGRITREKKEEQEQDLLIDIKRGDAEVENSIEKEEAMTRIGSGQGGNDINTGLGRKPGRPNKSGKEWDENGNNIIDDKNNWTNWNNRH